jgi:putative transcriptional regulator
VADSDLIASLLIAMPQLEDPNFKRSVMLIVHHDEGGTFGLVLNRPVDMSARDLCDSLEVGWGGDPSMPLHWGGPVQPNTGWMLFNEDLSTSADVLGVTCVEKGIYFAGSLDVLRVIAESPPADLRLYLGYAGWGPGQLEDEMAEGAWLVAPVSPEMIFDVPSELLWEQAVRSLGIDPATLIPTRGVH